MIGNSAPGINTGSDYTAPGGVGFAPQSRNLDAERAAWGDNAVSLVALMRRLFFARYDKYGGYKGERIGDAPVIVRPVNIPGAGVKPGALTDDIITAHFAHGGQYRNVGRFADRRGKGQCGISTTIGAHTLGPAGTAKYIRIDIDAHGKDVTPANAVAVAERNLAAAKAWCARLRSLGFRAVVLYDSDGRGGLWLDVYFADPIPAALAYAFARWLIRDWRSLGLAAEPEAFPKQDQLDAEHPFGNWCRLPGHHHRRPHWTRIHTDDGRLLAGADAVAHLLAVEGDAADLIPAEVLEQAERIVNPPPPPPPKPARVRRGEADPLRDIDRKFRAARSWGEKAGDPGEGGRNNTAFNYAAFCQHDLGFSHDTTFRIVGEWNAGLSAPLDDAELDEVVKSGKRYGGKVSRPRRAKSAYESAAPARDYDFSSLSGPPVLDGPVCGKAGCSPVCGCPRPTCPLGGLVPKRASRTQPPARTPDPTSALLRGIIGKPVCATTCPCPIPIGLDGVGEYDGQGERACDSWCRCLPCRTRIRWKQKAQHCPWALKHGTHVYRGTATGYAAAAKRLSRAGIGCEYHRTKLGAGEYSYILAIPRDAADRVAELAPEFTPVTGEQAARRLAHGVDLVPASLTGRKFDMSRGWYPDRPKRQRKKRAVQTPPTPDAPPPPEPAPEKLFTVTKTVPVCRLPELAEFFGKIGVRYEWDTLVNYHKGGSMVASLTWERPVDPELIEAIRKRRFELSVEWPTANPPSADNPPPGPWQPSDEPIPD